MAFRRNILVIFSLFSFGCFKGKFELSRNASASPTASLAAKFSVSNCTDPDVDQIPVGTSLTLCNGSTGQGTYVAPANCTTDGEQDCVVTGSFYAADASTIDGYDLRKGKSLGGVTGKKKDCRNGANSTVFNYDGSADSIVNTAVSVGASGDWWDTIDDANNGLSSGFGALPAVAAWSSDYYCDGSQIVDVTNTQSWLVPSGQSLYCSATTCTDATLDPFTTIYYDSYTKLYFTNPLIRRGGAAAAGTDWAEANIACDSLQSGDGTSKWRLPTQKEMMRIYLGGIAVPTTSKVRQTNYDLYWVATSYVTAIGSGWFVNLYTGRSYGSAKGGNRYAVMCVRS